MVTSDDTTPGDLRFDATTRIGTLEYDVSLTASSHEILVLIGPSGSGKSTTLNAIAGLFAPDTGTITLGNRVLFSSTSHIDVPPENRHVGIVFQDYALFPHLRVLENVAFGARGTKKQRFATAIEHLERVGMADYSHRWVSMLSGGERQRVALARALAATPAALLLDEPLAALDVATRSAIRIDLKRYLDDLAIPCVFVTHDPIDALVFGDRIAAIESGKITQTGSRDELTSTPRTPFIAEMTGLNLLRAHVKAGDGLKEARSGNAVFHVIADGLEGDIYLAFEPSQINLASELHMSSAQNVFPMIVRAVVPMGETVRVQLDGAITMTASVTRNASETLTLRPGSEVYASIKSTAIRVYR